MGMFDETTKATMIYTELVDNSNCCENTPVQIENTFVSEVIKLDEDQTQEW